MMGLENRVVLITGAGTGLGRAAALSFAEAGAKVVLCGRRSHRIEETASAVSRSGSAVAAIQADVSSPVDVERLIRNTVALFGRIDVVVNNAAVFEAGEVADTTYEGWERQISVNLNGVFLVIRSCLPVMRSQRYGRIINITSSMAPNGAGGFAAYAASKAGVESLTRAVAEDESNNGILCNLFNPGTFKSEMFATGKDPRLVTGELLRLAALPEGGYTGQLVEAAV